ncbi:TonB-dependent receptor [Novosphingobium olei]|uniref:TonB-dependent siderophore receptor n=1 Tax=Novosphingobium olei TaxID=2728851 RepID=A0A7Y0GBA4_9SPHN|nr:TonB-dependent siderophore receptor [Novosphingobium olei]NML94432.1 TonB-dependent siderophore receptor [Novosphingobium olei]
MIRQAVLLAGVAVLMPAIAQAEEVVADDGRVAIVVTGKADGYRPEDANAIKTPTPLVDVPQSVAVLTREQLDDQGVTQLGDALRYVPGVVLGQGEGHRDQVNLRGQNTTADFYLDGLRDDTQYYRSLYNIERVEVLKGANALLFGRGGGGGVVNRVSKTPALDKTMSAATAGVDTFGAFSIAGDLNQPLGSNLGARLNATYGEFRNHRQDFSGRFIGINPTLAFEPDADTRVELSYNYDDDDRTTDRGVPSINGKPLQGYDDTFFGSKALNVARVRAHIAQARLDHQLADNLTFNVIGQYSHTDKYYGNLFANTAVNPATNTLTLSGYSSATVRDSWIGQTNLVWEGRTGPVGHTLLAGFEVSSQDTSGLRIDPVFPGGASVVLAKRLTIPVATFTGTARVTDSKVDTWSAYLQDQIELAPFLQIVGGIRYDEFRIEGAVNGAGARRTDRKWSPRAGVILKPRRNMSIYASFTRSFLPQSGDQFGSLDATQATLDPEQFENLEAGLKWDIHTNLAFTAAIYRLTRDNSRFNNPVTGLAELSGRTRAQGVEFSLAGRILPDWQASLGLAWQEGEVRSATASAPAGRTLSQLPHLQASAWTRYDVTKRLGLGLGVTHQSSMFTTISNTVRLPAWTRVDAAVFYELNDRLSLQLNVENLFDTDYFPSAHTDNNITTGKPINARLTVRAKF